MNRTGLTLASLLLIFACALSLRLPKLELRPMHTDEAVQADKTRTLQETGTYQYNPHEYHGPSLHYLALPSMWISGGNYIDCEPPTFRVVPAVLGALMVLLLFLLRDGLGTGGMLCAGLLLACSPSMVYYNRYYIAETPLVFGSLVALAAGWRYLQKPSTGWAVLAAIGLAIMYTTKETWAFSVATTCGALFLIFLFTHKGDLNVSGVKAFIRVEGFQRRHLLWAASVFVVIGVLLFSAFFTNLRGPWDSVETYLAWGKNATAGDSPHLHPWHYFLKLLAYNRFEDKFIWSEGLILLLAFVGAASHVMGWNPGGANLGLVRFVTGYSVLLGLLYSVIPYKTPWCVLGFHLGFILLAGVGATTIVGAALQIRRKVVAGIVAGLAVILMLVGILHLFQQTCRANFHKVYCAHRRNPYVYGHTGTSVKKLVKRIEELARLAPEGKDAVVLVVAKGNDYWPLPYYLRHLKHAGFLAEPPADWSKYKPAVVAFLHDPGASTPITPPAGYESVGFYGLRPTVNYIVFARPDVYKTWRATLKAKTKK